MCSLINLQAINRLGLNTFGSFDPQDRIIEYNLESNVVGHLAGKTVNYFIHNVAARTATPGGGSVAALVGSLARELCICLFENTAVIL